MKTVMNASSGRVAPDSAQVVPVTNSEPRKVDHVPAQTPSTMVASIGVNAATAAAYLDACDEGMPGAAFDPGYYKACAGLLMTILALQDANELFSELLERSAAAREVAETIALGKELETNRAGSCPQLDALLRHIKE